MNTNTTFRTRELARRMSGTVEIALLWHPGSERVELSVRDRGTCAGFRLDVSPDAALDAFNHPFAYAPNDVGLG
jgi:hypothetical protein